MALKDWKKVGEMRWKKKLKTLMITGYGYEFPNNYLVRLFDDMGWTSESVELSKNFKSKSQALSFAKSYMRTH